MNRIKSFLAITAFTALVFTFIGCAPQYAFLSKGMPENFFSEAKIDIDDSKNVSYTFESKLADPFPYYKAFVDLNPSYKSVLKNYMNYKYTPVDSEDGNYHIDVILEECTYEAVHAGAQTARATNYATGATATATVNYMKVTTELVVKVRVNVDGKTSEKKITGMGEYTGSYTEYSTVTRSFDLAIRATISRMDRFLSTTIGSATPDP
jgi:hypothetical protein